MTLTVLNPKLWSIDRPNVYRMQAELLDGAGKVLDEHSDTFGLRTVEIRDRHLLLNGERVRLTGLTRHEDSPWEGLAETRGTMRQDFDDLKALHTDLTRPVHYPQNPYILDYADRHGILLVPEIPVWQFSEEQLSNPRRARTRTAANAGNDRTGGQSSQHFCLERRERERHRHPRRQSDIFAACANLSANSTRRRFVTYADDNLAKLERAEQSAANDADFLLMNQYFGTWHGPAAALNPALDRVNTLFPGKMVIISEFGFPGIFAPNPDAADRARIKIIEEQMPVLAARDWIAGTILWCYQDYKSRRNLWPGQMEGYVEHGVVDEWRQRKPSYEVWKEWAAPAKINLRWVNKPDSSVSFAATITPNTPQNIPYHPLRDYQAGSGISMMRKAGSSSAANAATRNWRKPSRSVNRCLATRRRRRRI